MTDQKIDFLQALIKEADAYTTLDFIESAVQQGMDLKDHPIQPLYLAVKSLPVEKTAGYLTKLSPEQRVAFMDLDLWEKDDLDVEGFSYWLKAYSLCDDEKIKLEFIKGDEFFVYLKGRFNIWTFDVEDPMYPEHDNYFLTDDSLLLFEFHEDFEYVNELREMVRALYADMGVENAYAYLFKLTSDSFMSLQEQEYQNKKERLRDFGFVDYFDALKLDTVFPSIEVMNNFIGKKEAVTGELDVHAKKQALHQSSLIAYKDKMNSFADELDKVVEEKRKDFLQFDFIRLINGSLSLANALKTGPVAMTRVGNKTRATLQLGFNYVIDYRQKNSKRFTDTSLFERFEFSDFYRIGNTLLKNQQKKIKKGLAQNGFDDSNDSFLGRRITDLLDNSFDEPVKMTPTPMDKPIEIIEVDNLWEWDRRIDTFVKLLPFIKSFYVTFSEMKKEGKVMDSFYLNYDLDNIDFEAIILSSFAGFFLDSSNSHKPKMGLTLDEFKSFVSAVINKEGKLDEQSLQEKLSGFVNTFGLNAVPRFDFFLIQILREQLEGYEYSKLSDDDFKHVGGPIIFA